MVTSGRHIFLGLALCLTAARADAAEFLLPLEAPRAPAAHLIAPPLQTGRPICVRLCDGYFFPLTLASGPFAAAQEEAACRALCPDASVAVYRLPGADGAIADAVSPAGESYSALPAAFRYRTATAPACACRRAGEARLDYWRDPTLRSGDAIMTAAGVVIFHGAGGRGPYRDTDFTPVGALAPAIPASSDDGGPPVTGGIEFARRGPSAGGAIRFLAAPRGGG